MGGDTIKYLTCNSDAFRVTMVDNGLYPWLIFLFFFILLFITNKNELNKFPGDFRLHKKGPSMFFLPACSENVNFLQYICHNFWLFSYKFLHRPLEQNKTL